MKTFRPKYKVAKALADAIRKTKTRKSELAKHMCHAPGGISWRLNGRTHIDEDYFIKAYEFMGVKLPAKAFVDVPTDAPEPVPDNDGGSAGTADEKPEFDTRAEVDRLAAIADDIDRDIAVRESAKQHGVTVAVLRKAVEKQASESRDDAELTAAAKAIRTVEPCSGVVDGQAMAGGIRAAFTRHLHLPEHADVILTMWTISSHAIDVYEKFPFIVMTSAEPNCGKSHVLKLLRYLLQKAALSAGMTGPTIFRVMDKYGPALLMDEVDQWLKGEEGQSINGIINGAHDRETATIWRCVGDDYEPTPFDVWGPKVFAGIGERTKTLSSRAHIISMMRSPPDATFIDLETKAQKAVLTQLASQAARWAADHAKALQERPAMPSAVFNRARDNWRPLFAVANQIGGDWPQLVKAAADHAIAEEREYQEESLGLKLIRDAVEVIKRRGRVIDGEINLQATTLRDELVRIDDSPWAHFKNDRAISPRSIAFILKPYKIIPKKRSDSNYWRITQFEKALFAFARDEDSQAPPEQVPPSSIAPQTQSKHDVKGWRMGDSNLHQKGAHPPSGSAMEDGWKNDGACDAELNYCNKKKNGAMELNGACSGGGETENGSKNKIIPKEADAAAPSEPESEAGPEVSL